MTQPRAANFRGARLCLGPVAGTRNIINEYIFILFIVMERKMKKIHENIKNGG